VDPVAPFLWFVDRALGLLQQRRRVRVLVHRGIFLPESSPYYFVKVTNLSANREIEITHVWFETKPPVHILNPSRPLPARLRLDETFETWAPLTDVPNVPNAEQLVRVLLSNGKTLKSRPNTAVPLVGYVAGPGNR